LWGAVTVATTGSAEFDDAATQRLERFANLVALAVSAAEAREKLVSLATSDELTGLPNQRAFRERLDREVRRAVRYGRPLSLVMLDIDHFKAINDTHGHPAGDRVLAAIARLLQGFVRGEELMARIGGEEFAWLLPEADVLRAGLAAERAIELVSRDALPGVGRVTVSAGVCELARAGSAAGMVECADRALYAAKAGGRNRVAATPADDG
jgi:diguanylate cyclase (GGDEF)-like protein